MCCIGTCLVLSGELKPNNSCFFLESTGTSWFFTSSRYSETPVHMMVVDGCSRMGVEGCSRTGVEGRRPSSWVQRPAVGLDLGGLHLSLHSAPADFLAAGTLKRGFSRALAIPYYTITCYPIPYYTITC